MNNPCFICKGACCESIAIGLKSIDQDNIDWLNLHEGVKATKQEIRFEVKCSELKDGLCNIHDTRPQICRKYQVGSPACLNAINQRRIIKEPILKAIKLFNA